MREKGFKDNFWGVWLIQPDDIIYRDIKTERETNAGEQGPGSRLGFRHVKLEKPVGYANDAAGWSLHV